jgi:glucose/arabinose dehydrogenase
MQASSFALARRLWLALPLLVLVVVLAASGAGATDDATPSKIYMPLVRVEPGPPQFEFTALADLGDLTITDIANAGDERLFVATREGVVHIVYANGSVAAEPFMDARHLVQLGADGNENDFEQGFLGLAFHPDYPANPYVYFAHTTPRTLTVTRAAVSPTNPNKINPQTFQPVLFERKPDKDAAGNLSAVHNGGDLAFGPDGYLYIPIGDGGPDPYDPWGVPGDPNNFAQRRDTIFGSVLRIDVNPTRGLVADCGIAGRYSIPRDNPWLGDDGCDELWMKGLRNPWRMAIDPLNGDLYLGDVGEWQREEVNYWPRTSGGGANFGWHCYEGTFDYAAFHRPTFPNSFRSCTAGAQFVPPIFEYGHGSGGCSVIGGVVYRGNKYPTLHGRYFFADWCTGELWTMARQGNQWQVDPAGDTVLPISTFGEDNSGGLYAGVYMDGTIYKVSVR